MAAEVKDYLEKHEPAIYEEMFGGDPKQRVQVWFNPKKGKLEYKPEEIIMGFLERANKVDFNKPEGKRAWYNILDQIRSKSDNVLDYTSEGGIVEFLIDFSKK